MYQALERLHEPKRAGVRPETSVQNLPGNETSGLTFVLETGPERPGDLVEVAGRNQKTQTLVQKVDAKCVHCIENTDLEDSRGDGPGSAIDTQSANPRAESRRKVNTLQRKCLQRLTISTEQENATLAPK